MTEAQKRAYAKYNKSKKKKETNNRYRKNNAEECRKRESAYREQNKESILKRERNWRQGEQGKEKIKQQNKRRRAKSNEWYNEKYENDLNFRIKAILRARQHRALSDNKYNRTMTATGCTVVFFKQYIEERFLLGMNWDNWGEVWHIDHIKPCDAFDLTDPIEQKKCFHYFNQRPLWTKDNLEKSNIYQYNKEHERLLESIIV